MSTQFFERNLSLCFSQKDQVIHASRLKIKELEGQVLSLRQKLIEEDDILSDENINKIREQVKEYLEKDSIIQNSDEILNIIEKSQHSGVTYDLQAVWNQLKTKKIIEEDEFGQMMDKDALSMNSFMFLRNLEEHLLTKARKV
jgi:hypothetical protein